MKLLDLFSGIGGFSLGLEKAEFETIAFCEIEPYAQKVLKKHWADVTIATDVTKLTYREGVLYDGEREIYRGSVDAICGGFPCQDISVAGRQQGIGEGTRSGLWSECARLLGEIRPRYAIFENVSALLSGERGDWFKRVLWDISKIGYDAEWHCIPASELGAHHHRDRVWIIAYPTSAGEGSSAKIWKSVDDSEVDSRVEQRLEQRSSEIFSDTDSEGLEGRQEAGDSEKIRARCYEWLKRLLDGYDRRAWQAQPGVCGIVDGLPNRTHRLRCLGNAVVPQIPELIGRAIMEVESD